MHNKTPTQKLAESIAFEIHIHYRRNRNYIDVVSIKNILSALLPDKKLIIDLEKQIKASFTQLQYKSTDSENVASMSHSQPDHPIERGIRYFLEPSAKKSQAFLAHDIFTKAMMVINELPLSSVIFIDKLDNEIKRINESSYDNTSLKEQKIIALLELKSLLLTNERRYATNETIESWKQTLSPQYNKTNYELICTQRRTGFFSFSNPKKPHSQQFIDDFLTPSALSQSLKL